MYHYVRPIKNSDCPKIMGLELDKFEKQISYFKNNFNFITAQELVQCMYYKKSIPPNSILLTFDDGFKDHYLYVFPVLKKLHIQGLFFPAAKPIVEQTILDVHKIHFILAKSQNVRIIMNEIFDLINKFRKEYCIKSPESFFDDLAIPNRFDTKEVVFIKRILQRDLPRNIRTQITDYLFKKFVTEDQKSFSKQIYLSLDEIKEMKEYEMYFGAHSYSHEWFSNLTKVELQTEIKKSIEFCSKINCIKDNLIMCYPYGDYNQESISELKKEKFVAGLTTKVGDAILNTSNAFHLERYDTNDFLT